ncbi:hypothetical protein BKA64DRAFT_748984 [Cadophora sp. MPI-SDFR-AT-0126]|nr:hypothetical protein BKA64DRAFT_748984 [Leotiomycetes sp. MPI-SDFR-AT-0126]
MEAKQHPAVQWRATFEEAIEDLQSSIMTMSNGITDMPYLHAFWMQRAGFLLQLGYPELSAADAYKSILLCSAGLDYSISLGEAVRFNTAMHTLLVDDMIWGLDKEGTRKLVHRIIFVTRKNSYFTLIQAMMDLSAYPEAIKACIEASRLHPSDSVEFNNIQEAAQFNFDDLARIYSQQRFTFHEQKRLLSFGSYYVRTYPWLPVEYRTRSAAAIKVANKNLKKVSNCLEIRPSSIGGKASGRGEVSCYGVFATKRIAKGQTLISETHPFAVSVEQPEVHCGSCFIDLASCGSLHTLKCCSIYRYCSSHCERIARCYHSAICGKSFSEILENAHTTYGGKWEGKGYLEGKTALSHYTGWKDKTTHLEDDYRFAFPDQIPVFLIRFLAMIIQAGCEPLDHPVISPLMPNESSKMLWSLNGMVSGPIEALQILGINVFADQRFDTWILLTIWNRIKNNCMGSDIGVPNRSFSPSYSWFNHSCSYNAEMVVPKSELACDMEMKVVKTIQKGEEVFVTYIPIESLALKKSERHKVLRSWFGSACMCQRCLKER